MIRRLSAIVRHAYAALLFVLCGPCALVDAQASATVSETVSRHDRTVVILSKGLTYDDSSICSGTLVSSETSLFLVAPRIKWSEDNTQIGIPTTADQDSQWVDVKNVSDWSAGDPRHDFPEYGTSVLPLEGDGKDIDHLRQVAIPITAFQPLMPMRGTRVEIVGFPLEIASLYTDVPPAFTWTSSVASAKLRLPRLPSGFLAAPPCSRVFTGAPVYLHSKREDDIAYVGSVVICLPNDPKLPTNWALILPAATIRQLIESLEATTEEDTAK